MFKKKIFLIDGSAYIYRSYHAVRNLSTSKGFPTNAVFGFTRMIIKLIEEKKPEYIGMILDAKGPTFRHKMYSEYKATRPPMPDDLVMQLPFIKKVIAGFNLPFIELSGFEADDIIGTLAEKACNNGFEVIIVTGDKDLMQLITDDIIIWDPMKEKTIDRNEFKNKYDLKPEQLIELMALWGDSSDNIPGVPSIGEKTACSLIQSYSSLDGVYENIENIKRKKQKQNLIDFKDQAYLSKKLVTIDKNAPIDFDPSVFKIKNPDKKTLALLFKELEFRQLQKDFPIEVDHSKKKYHNILKKSELETLIDNLKQNGFFALDTETTSEFPMLAELVGFSFSFNPDEAFYIPCMHDYVGVPEQLDLKYVLDELKPILENSEIKKIGQNIKYDQIVLKHYDIDLNGVIFDTMIGSYLLNPSDSIHSLERIAMDLLTHQMISFKDITGTGKSSILFNKVPLEKAKSYACEDADITFQVSQIFDKKLDEAGLKDLFNNIEMPLVQVLYKMEMNGILIDKKILTKTSKEFGDAIKSLEDKIYKAAGESFNIQSHQQLGYILFEKLKLPVQKKTKKKTGYSTDVNVLTSLAQKHEIPALILEYRTLSKLKSTYTDSLLELINPKTQRIHTSYNQSVTATGRLSSSDPNLQNIPIKTEEGRKIRKAFIAQPGYVLLSADYSQIELRLLAHFANDKILIQAFNEDEDIHKRTASEIFQVFPQMVTDDLRRQAKTINFGIIYGMSAFRLSNELKISRKMAQNYINSYFARYKGVHTFIEQTILDSEKSGMTKTICDRIRMIPEIKSSNKNVRAMGERIAINTIIQGSAADLIKIAMIELDKKLNNHKSKMLLTVHDEIVLEVLMEELDEIKQIVRNTMENVWELKIPLKVNINTGQNWEQAH